jgi:hypothetical protein
MACSCDLVARRWLPQRKSQGRNSVMTSNIVGIATLMQGSPSAAGSLVPWAFWGAMSLICLAPVGRYSDKKRCGHGGMCWQKIERR